MFLRPQVFFFGGGEGHPGVSGAWRWSPTGEGEGGSFKSVFFELDVFHSGKKKSIQMREMNVLVHHNCSLSNTLVRRSAT